MLLSVRAFERSIVCFYNHRILNKPSYFRNYEKKCLVIFFYFWSYCWKNHECRAESQIFRPSFLGPLKLFPDYRKPWRISNNEKLLWLIMTNLNFNSFGSLHGFTSEIHELALKSVNTIILGDSYQHSGFNCATKVW